MTQDRDVVVEITEMRMRAGVDEAELLELDRRLQQDVFPFLRGFVRRTTARGEDRWWAFVVLWSDPEDADGAAAALDTDPVATELHELAEDGTARRRRYVTLD
jgi:hypothetical protein